MPEDLPKAPVNVDRLRSLLRLYLSWPEKFDDGNEVAEFHRWLKSEFDEGYIEDLVGSIEDIQAFFQENEGVLYRARHFKGWSVDADRDTRVDARVAINTQVLFLVYDCTRNTDYEGRIFRGIMLDMAKSGMRIETNEPVPEGAILSLSVVRAESGATMYNLTGEVRWSREHAEAAHIGISVFNIEDYANWQEFYDQTPKPGATSAF